MIWIRPESEKPVVMCANHDRGALTRKACTAGCIGCMKCEKSCPEGAIKVTNNVARVDYEKCTELPHIMNVCELHAITIPKIILTVGSQLLTRPTAFAAGRSFLYMAAVQNTVPVSPKGCVLQKFVL